MNIILIGLVVFFAVLAASAVVVGALWYHRQQQLRQVQAAGSGLMAGLYLGFIGGCALLAYARKRRHDLHVETLGKGCDKPDHKHQHQD